MLVVVQPAGNIEAFSEDLEKLSAGENRNDPVLKIVSSIRGERVEQLWLTATAIHALASGIEITVAGETWIISAHGELTIHQANGQHIVLEPAEGVVR